MTNHVPIADVIKFEEANPRPKDNTEIAMEAIEKELGITHIKDTTLHHIRQPLPDEGVPLGDILDVAKDRLALPNDVTKFTKNVERNFHRTADALRQRAGILRHTAAFLDDRAQKLDDAVPRLSKEIEDWISFERECAAKEQSLSLIKPE